MAAARERNLPNVDYRRHPERYRIGRGEEGVLTVEPYKSEILPHWRFRTPALAATSARTTKQRAAEIFGKALARVREDRGYLAAKERFQAAARARR